MHIFLACPNSAGLRGQIGGQVLTIWNEMAVEAWERIPSWFLGAPDSEPWSPEMSSSWERVQQFPKDLGCLGFIPRHLVRLIKSNEWKEGVTCTMVIRELQRAVLDGMRGIWRAACDKEFGAERRLLARGPRSRSSKFPRG